MSLSSILKYDEVNVKEINYLNPERVGHSFFSSISYGKNLKPLYIQTPKLVCKTDINDIKDKRIPYLDFDIPNGIHPSNWLHF